MKTYYIYHIRDVKIGCTTEIIKRMNDQGFTDWEILEEHTDIHIASEREQELQKQYGYRVDSIPYYQSIANRPKGVIWTKESIEKMKESKKDYKHTTETIKKIVESRKWYNHSDETKQKMKESAIGRIIDEETKLKISQKNKNPSLETRKKMSDARLGIKKDKNQLQNFNKLRSELIECPYCKKEGAKFNMKRYHFDNCKHKNIE